MKRGEVQKKTAPHSKYSTGEDSDQVDTHATEIVCDQFGTSRNLLRT